MQINNIWRAQVWLVQAEYGLPAGRTDIHGSGPTPSVPNDINEAGSIVGVTGGTAGGDSSAGGEAVVWQLGSPITKTLLGTTGGSWSAAYALNNNANPVIVGRSEDDVECPFTRVIVPFRLRLGVSGMAAITAGGFHTGSAAMDVDSTLVTPWPPIVGVLETGVPPDCIEIDPIDCILDDRLPVRWAGVGAATLSMLEPDTYHMVRGSNDSGQMAGFGTIHDDPCRVHALAWSIPGALSHVDLGAITSSVKNTRAEAIAEVDSNGRLHVVGTNESDDLALLWSGTPSGQSYSWTSRVLENELCDCTSAWEIKAAYDINDSGVIIALADADTGTGTDLHAVLLVPVSDCDVPACMGDVNGSGTVDGTDLALLLGAFGEFCPSQGDCNTDVNCDGVVNGTDLALLLGNWGSCGSGFTGGGEASESPSLEELVEFLIEAGHPDLADLLELIWPY